MEHQHDYVCTGISFRKQAFEMGVLLLILLAALEFYLLFFINCFMRSKPFMHEQMVKEENEPEEFLNHLKSTSSSHVEDSC